jgi:hypothetical protein
LKAVLKPTPLKIATALVIFLLVSYLWRLYFMSRVSDASPWGVPLPFYMTWGPCPPGETCSESNALFLFLDLLIWYIVSALLISRFRRT